MQDNTADMVNRLRAGTRPIVVLLPAETTEFSSLQNLPTGLEDKKTSNSNGTEDSLPGCNMASL
jgi:hypothetical protein